MLAEVRGELQPDLQDGGAQGRLQPDLPSGGRTLQPLQGMQLGLSKMFARCFRCKAGSRASVARSSLVMWTGVQTQTQGFSYFCDDGSAPDPSGCCQILFTRHAQCPMLPFGPTSCAPKSSMCCRKRNEHCITLHFRFNMMRLECQICCRRCEYGWKSARWSAEGWKRHCQCGGCPSTIEEARAIVNQSLPVVLEPWHEQALQACVLSKEQAATKELMFILMTRGLNSLSSEMRHLFAMQPLDTRLRSFAKLCTQE